jgi:hypothetical protein
MARPGWLLITIKFYQGIPLNFLFNLVSMPIIEISLLPLRAQGNF